MTYVHETHQIHLAVVTIIAFQLVAALLPGFLVYLLFVFHYENYAHSAKTN